MAPPPELLLLLPLLLAPAPLGAGQMNLTSPQNVQVDVINTNFTLRWSWGSENDFNVTFSAQYQRFDDDEKETTDWEELSGCQNVTVTECDFSSTMTAYLDSYNVRIRAEKGEEKSPWTTTLSFSPYSVAKIGPPEVQLESIDGVVKINISPPEENQNRKMWTNDDICFTYKAVFWENSSNAEPKNIAVNRRHTLYDLAPETTYCLKVQARIISERKVGSFSPVYCIKTTDKAWNVLPYPTNVEIHALNFKFLLFWDNQYDQNVTFTVQYLSGYLKVLREDHSDKWNTVSGCENITVTQCDFSSDIETSGTYFLRVQAMNGYNKSRWSNEIKVEDPCVVNEIGPPSITLSSSKDSIRIQLTPPGESENKSMSEFYDLSYRVVYWKNSSDTEEKIKEEQQLLFTISDLTPFVLYCLKVQAFSPAYQKDGHFSDVACIKTLYDKTSPLTILKTFFIAMFAFFVFASLLIFGIYYIFRRIRYAFFPSCKPPSNIECLGGQPFNSPFLLTSEEPTENYCIIENIVIEETNQTDFKDYKHSKQSTRDSGNYSNDDDTSGTKVLEETLEQETA